MENKKGSLFWDIFRIILVLAIIVLFVSIFVKVLREEYKEYKTYKNFCADKTEFCYCEHFECEFRTSRTEKWINGELVSDEFSNQTKELCKLAKELDDKKIMYRVGC